MLKELSKKVWSAKSSDWKKLGKKVLAKIKNIHKVIFLHFMKINKLGRLGIFQWAITALSTILFLDSHLETPKKRDF